MTARQLLKLDDGIFMSAVLKLVDEEFGTAEKARRPFGELRLASLRVTAREIIRERVTLEVALINGRSNTGFSERSFIVALDPNSPEMALNPRGTRRKSRQLNADEEIARTFVAFEKRRFLLLVDDRQLDGLDDELGFTDGSEVTFLKLSLLKGG